MRARTLPGPSPRPHQEAPAPGPRSCQAAGAQQRCVPGAAGNRRRPARFRVHGTHEPGAAHGAGPTPCARGANRRATHLARIPVQLFSERAASDAVALRKDGDLDDARADNVAKRTFGRGWPLRASASEEVVEQHLHRMWRLVVAVGPGSAVSRSFAHGEWVRSLRAGRGRRPRTAACGHTYLLSSSSLGAPASRGRCEVNSKLGAAPITTRGPSPR